MEIAEATAEAHARGERSVCFFDNLSGHTTAEHKLNLKRAGCDRHLLPTDSTGELMFIDDGIGARIKHLIGEQQDDWQEQGDNLSRWSSGPKDGGLRAWEKRVHMTLVVGRAWETLCTTCACLESSPADIAQLRLTFSLLLDLAGTASRHQPLASACC